MQTSNALMLQKSQGLFKCFCRDMEILPPYTPLFMIDMQGRIVEKRRLRLSRDDFSSIFSVISQKEISNALQCLKHCDVYIPEAAFGSGSDFVVISKDKYGFSRCVVVSCSEENCTRLHEYFEKLACYRDYLDSFASVYLDGGVKTPALRLFKSRLNGASELLRLSVSAGEGRPLSFPLKSALRKLAEFALSSQDSKGFRVVAEGLGEDIAVRASENFFKLTACLMGLLIRQSKSGVIEIRVLEADDGDEVNIGFFTPSGNGQDEMTSTALIKAFRRSGIEAYDISGGGEMAFCITAKRVREAGTVLRDSVEIMREIEGLLSDRLLADMFFMAADITKM